MYQAASIDTSQIVPVNINAAQTLPEVPVGHAASPGKTALTQTQDLPNQPPAAPVTSNLIEVPTNSSPVNEWPQLEVMITELQTSGILNPELGVPIAINTPAAETATTKPESLEPTMITLANTAVNFERPSADYILNQPDKSPKLSGWLIATGLGLLVIMGLVGFMYSNLLSQGLTQDEIMQTALDSFELSQ